MLNSENPVGAIGARNSPGTVIIGVLAIAQAVAAILRAVHWFDAGSDLIGQGLFLLPLIGAIAMARGIFVGIIAFLFVVFACALLLRQRWAKGLGIALAVINLLLVLGLLMQGESLARALPWVVVPAVMLMFLPSNPGPPDEPHH